MTIFFLHFLFLTCCIIYLTKLFIPPLFCSIEYLHYVHYISMILEERVWVKKWENLALEKCSVHFLVCNKEVHRSLAIPCVWHGDLFLLVREGRMEGTSRKTSERINGQSKEQQLIHSCKVWCTMKQELWGRTCQLAEHKHCSHNLKL